MKKKGFTLVELLAVIAILGILMVLVTPAVMAIRKTVLTNTLKSKINTIDNAAADYGQDVINTIPIPNNNFNRESPEATKYFDEANCRKVYLDVLIQDGYIKPDKKDTLLITNPLTGEALQNPLTDTSIENDISQCVICVRFDTKDAESRQIVAYIVGEKCLTGEEDCQ